MKNKTTIIVLALFLFIPNKVLFSQDSTKFFFGYDLFKGLINEHSITFGYNLTQKHSIMGSFGCTYDNKSLREQYCGISPSQDKYPFWVYKGPVYRLAYAYRLLPFYFIGADLFFKQLHYSNHEFHDSMGDSGDVFFTRNEESTVYGFHLNTGFIYLIPKTPIIISPSFGMGETFKYRKYNTINSQISGLAFSEKPIGSFLKHQHYLSIIMNLNIGITF